MADAQHVPAPPADEAPTTDRLTVRLVVLLLGLLALVATCGLLVLSYHGRTVPDSLIAIGSATVGALSALLAKTSSPG